MGCFSLFWLSFSRYNNTTVLSIDRFSTKSYTRTQDNETDKDRGCSRTGHLPRHHSDNQGRHEGRQVQKRTHYHRRRHTRASLAGQGPHLCLGERREHDARERSCRGALCHLQRREHEPRRGQRGQDRALCRMRRGAPDRQGKALRCQFIRTDDDSLPPRGLPGQERR